MATTFIFINNDLFDTKITKNEPRFTGLFLVIHMSIIMELHMRFNN